MRTPVGSLSWEGVVALGAVALVIYWVLRSDVLASLKSVSTFGKNLNEGIKATFDPNYAGSPLELTEEASDRSAYYVSLGYAKWVNGVFTITPAGEAYIARQAAK